MKEEERKDTCLSFKLGNELFAVSVSKVLEVLQKQTITLVPDTPDYILGVINFRGEIVPVADSRTKFHMPRRTDTDKYVIIVMELESGEEKMVIGVTADSVMDVMNIETKDIKPVPNMGSHLNSAYIAGMITVNDRFIMILDVDKVFSSSEISEISEVVQSE